MKASKFFKLPLLAATIAVTGCASSYTPPPAGAQQANMKAEAESITKNLGCEWMQLPDPMYPAKGNDLACVADTFASVILFVEPSENMTDGGIPKVEKVKLVWKEWNESVRMTDTKRDASRFIAYIAQRFFPAEKGPKLVDMFFGKVDDSLNTEKLDVKYTYRKQPALNLHRMEIVNTDPERNIFTYPAPHQIPDPVMTPTSNTSNGE